MGKRHPKQKRQPVTTKDTDRRTTKSKRKLISTLHTALKELERVKGDAALQQTLKALKIQQLEHTIKELGGLDAYQQSSLLGERLHGNVNTSKWVLQKLKEFNIRAEKGCRLRLLDVGALRLNYTKQTKWLDAEAIDLNPQCDGIIKADFSQYKVGQTGVYDIMVVSLVLNFVSCSSERGEMLRRCQQLCQDGGHVVMVLPRACLENSRYLDHDLFQQMMESLTFDLVTQHTSHKLSYKMFRKAERRKEGGKSKQIFAKREIRNGTKCNNFCIVLR